MNKDYAKYVKNKAGFIINYEVKNGMIYVTTPETLKSGHPYVFKATKEKIEELEKRLEAQYRLVIKNQDEIIENQNKLTWGIIVIPLLLGFTSALATIISEILGIVLCATAVSSLVLGVIVNVVSKQNAKNKLAVYAEFLEKRRTLEQTSKNDQNITLHISQKANQNITANSTLNNEGLIDSILNVNFMDKTSLKDLKEMLLRLRVSEGLASEVEFQMPEENHSIIRANTKTRKPKKNKRK